MVILGGGFKSLLDLSHWTYFSKNIMSIWNEHFIPGVLEGHKNKGLNGVLWSITLELRLYFFIALVAMIGLFRDKLLASFVYFFLLLVLMINSDIVPIIGSNKSMFGVDGYEIFSAIFLVGGLFYLLEEPLKFRVSSVILFSLLIYLSTNTALYKFTIFTFVIFFALWIATNSIVKKYKLSNDYSYGVYLYGWPAQQIAFTFLMCNGLKITPFFISVISCPISLFLAYLSWHLIEKRCIKFAHKAQSIELIQK